MLFSIIITLSWSYSRRFNRTINLFTILVLFLLKVGSFELIGLKKCEFFSSCFQWSKKYYNTGMIKDFRDPEELLLTERGKIETHGLMCFNINKYQSWFLATTWNFLSKIFRPIPGIFLTRFLEVVCHCHSSLGWGWEWLVQVQDSWSPRFLNWFL